MLYIVDPATLIGGFMYSSLGEFSIYFYRFSCSYNAYFSWLSPLSDCEWRSVSEWSFAVRNVVPPP